MIEFRNYVILRFLCYISMWKLNIDFYALYFRFTNKEMKLSLSTIDNQNLL
jgi:hypothetical protein